MDIVTRSEFDCIWFEQTQSAFPALMEGLLRPGRRESVVLRPHNVESHVIRRIEVGSMWGGQYFLALESLLLRSYEMRLYRHVDLIAPISEEDLDAINDLTKPPVAKMVLLPVMGSSSRGFRCKSASQRRNLLFVGDCRWGPNRRAALWVISELAPALAKSHPDLSIRMVGRETENLTLSDYVSNVKLLGFVDNLVAEYDDALFSLAPVTDGGGVNIKVIEALSHGVPVIGSSFAKRGIQSDAYLVAETPEDYVAIFDDILADGHRVEKLDAVASQFSKCSERRSRTAVNEILESIFQ